MTERQRGKANRLAREKSPYLLEHAFNLVDWYPWGEDAFAKAREEKKPIFLSIGYSTCHWCHVMAHESFEDEKIAAILNEKFVPIKVDREERPELDEVYMKAVTALTGQGGWPLSVFLTPTLKPFYGGTYFPPVPRHGLPGFPEVLNFIADTWKTRREEVVQSSEEITKAVAEGYVLKREGQLSKLLLDNAYAVVLSAHDPQFGGFGRAAQVPAPELPRLPAPLQRQDAEGLRPAPGPQDARRDGRRGHPRPARRRVPQIFDRQVLARPSLREDALRQRPLRQGLRGRLPRHATWRDTRRRPGTR